MGSTEDEVVGACHWYSAAELGMRLENLIWRSGANGEFFQLAHLFPWPAQLVCSQGMVSCLGPSTDTGIRQAYSCVYTNRASVECPIFFFFWTVLFM